MILRKLTLTASQKTFFSKQNCKKNNISTKQKMYAMV